MAFVGFGGFNRANQAAILQQQVADMKKAQSIMQQIGYVPQGGPVNTHVDVNRAVHIGGARTSIEQAPGNVYTVAPGGPEWIQGLGVDLNGDGKFEHGKDGHLALDLNGDGVYTREDVRDTLQMLKIFSGETGKEAGVVGGGFNQADQAKLLLLQARGKQADLNKDGVLSSWELTRMGGRAVVDSGNSYGPLETRTLPGAYTPDYRPQYQPSPYFGGHYSPFSAPMNFGPPAFFVQVLQSMMSYFARPY